MIYWPNILPNPNQRYSASTDPKLAVTEFDRNSRQRRKYSTTEELIQVSWRFSQLQFDMFRAFVETVLESGSLEFTVEIIGLDGLESRIVKIQAGKSLMQYVSDGWVDVSATLIGLPASPMPALIYDLLLATYGDQPDLFLLISLVLESWVASELAGEALEQFVSDFVNLYT